MQAAGPGVSLQELAVETVHCWVFAQSVGAGGDEGLGVGVVVAEGEGILLQELTAVMGERTIKSSQTER